MVNGLRFDRDSEERAVETFANNVLTSGQDYLESGQELPYVPTWNRVLSVCPTVPSRLAEIAAKDFDEFGCTKSQRLAVRSA